MEPPHFTNLGSPTPSTVPGLSLQTVERSTRKKPPEELNPKKWMFGSNDVLFPRDEHLRFHMLP